MFTKMFIAATAVVALGWQTPPAEAFASFNAKLPNAEGFPDAPAIGHPDAAGTQGLNNFGKDWKRLGKGWTTAYCMADSDGDGFSNGQELGDPCCKWTPTSTGSLIKEGISHPGDKTKTPTNPKLKEKCSTGGGGGDGAGGKNDTASSPGTVGPGAMPPDEDVYEHTAFLSEATSARVDGPLRLVGSLAFLVALGTALM